MKMYFASVHVINLYNGLVNDAADCHFIGTGHTPEEAEMAVTSVAERHFPYANGWRTLKPHVTEISVYHVRMMNEIVEYR